MPIIETRGALSSRGYGQFAQSAAAPTAGAFIEDVFSTTLYTGTGAAQSIPNTVNLGGGATSPGWLSILSASTSLQASGIAIDSSNNVYACGLNQTTVGSSLLVNYSQTGAIGWQQNIFSAAINNLNAVTVHSSGNVYVAGRLTVGTNQGLFLAKYTSAGAPVWQVLLNQSGIDLANSVVTDSSENIYVCGRTSGGAVTNAFLLAKYNSSGSLLWQRTLDGANTQEAFGIVVDSSGNSYVAGQSDATGNSAFLFKYDTSGNLQWQTLLNGFEDAANAVALDPAGFVYMAGSTREGTSTLGFLLAKYDFSGALIWKKLLGTSNVFGINVTSAAVDTSGNICLAGRDTSGTPRFGVFAKFDPSGNLLWQRKLTCQNTGGQTIEVFGLAVSGTQSVYFSGLIGSSFFVGRLPADGSGVGFYSTAGVTIEYSASSYTAANSTATSTAGGLTSATGTLTASTPTVTLSSGTPAASLATISQGLGGLVWIKGRSGATDHAMYDTVRGATFDLASNLNSSQTTQAQGLTAFLGSGFSIGTLAKLNTSAAIYAAWTFAEQPKFFDIVTYTGTGANRTVAHNLGSEPGCIIVKKTSGTGDWFVYHRSVGASRYLVLNTTAAEAVGSAVWASTAPTSSVFTVGTFGVNDSGATYVAYLFAHDAGGFGASGTDNVISCGSYTGNGAASGPTVTLGWEPQFLIIKRASGGTANWFLMDNVRGVTTGSNDAFLEANTSSNESLTNFISFTSTGFDVTSTSAAINASGGTYIYIAIRRGPMRTPTSGSSVFTPTVYTGTNVNNRLVNTSIAPDMVWMRQRDDTVLTGMVVGDRLRGQPYLFTDSTAVEATSATAFDQQLVSATEYGTAFSAMNGVYVGTDATAKLNVNTTANNHIAEAFRRAPGFFDVVCYTGTGVTRTVNHNLGVVPEIIIVKSRSPNARLWPVAVAPSTTLILDANNGDINSFAGYFDNTMGTSTTFSVRTDSDVNASGNLYVAYLFASCPGVSKVGSYTGTGSTVQVDCGFTAGARFVLIKRRNAAGDWYVWDSARGIIAGNDPYLVLNSTAAEVTSTDWVDTLATGFEVSNAGSNLVNVNGGNYIFLAIA